MYVFTFDELKIKFTAINKNQLLLSSPHFSKKETQSNI